MKPLNSPPERILIASHPAMPHAAALAETIASFLKQKKVDVVTALLYDQRFEKRLDSGWADVLVTLGGDGTMLRAGHLSGPTSIPMLGLNMGRLGFLTEAAGERWKETCERLLQGQYWLEDRMMLQADYYSNGDHRGSWQVVNECVVGRGEQVRPVELITEVDGHFLTRYMADGLIVSTATGSTGYALAAGGPILPPTSRSLLIVPVAPHLSVDRAIVLPEESTVCIRVHTDHQATVCVDGQEPVPVRDGDYVHLQSSEFNVQFVRTGGKGYFYQRLTSHMNIHATNGEQG